MREEIEAAAAWWAERLRNEEPDSYYAKRQPLTEEMIERFHVALIPEIEAHILRYGWYVDEPNRASALRGIFTDPPDEPLVSAAESAGILYPRRFNLANMWINPGCVKVSWTADPRYPDGIIYRKPPSDE